MIKAGISISGGQFKGHRLQVPRHGVRPTSSKIREALFSMLEHHFKITTNLQYNFALDLCAGTGALGLEALSRGIEHCLFIEKHRQGASILEQNLEKFPLPPECWQLAVVDGLKFLKSPHKFDPLGWIKMAAGWTIFCDPPYNQPVMNWLKAIFESVFWLKPCILALETGPLEALELNAWPSVELVFQKDYKETMLWVLKNDL